MWMIPTVKRENEEIEIMKNTYSSMLNTLNPNPIRGELIERRHKITFKFPDKKKEKESIGNKNIKIDKDQAKISKEENHIFSYAQKATGFLSLD